MITNYVLTFLILGSLAMIVLGLKIGRGARAETAHIAMLIVAIGLGTWFGAITVAVLVLIWRVGFVFN